MESVAIVTGGAQGIGKAICKTLLSEGYKVYLFDVDIRLGEGTETELCQKFGENRAKFIRCDVADKAQFTESFNSAVKKHGNISIMVNNAGIADEHNYENCIAVNLTAVIHGCTLAIKNMRKDQGGKGGTIVNVASMAALGAYYMLPTYCATKSGVLNFTKSWATHPNAEKMGLTFMCLCPGYVDTQLVDKGASKTLDPAAFEASKQKMGMLKLDVIETAFQQLLKDKQNGSVLEVSTVRIEYLKDTVNSQTKV